MADPDPMEDPDAAVAKVVEFLSVRPSGDGWVGSTPDWFGPVLFGGFVLGQAVHAATRTAPEGSRMHSMHGYFLAPRVAGHDVSYEITPLRDGRSFASRQLRATQDGRAVFTMTCSFTADTEGYEYGRDLDESIPGPDELEPENEPGPWDTAEVGPTAPGPDGFMDSTHRIWLRAKRELPDDPHLHDAVVAVMTDITWTGTRPLHLEGDTQGLVSLDHAIWFHRRVRPDDWLFYDVHSLVNAGGRGLVRGTMHGPDRRLAVSVTQELRLRRYEDVPEPADGPGRT
jgi:acyl-CoA thioesterase-2